MAEPTDPTMAQILKAIEKAASENGPAFKKLKKALGTSESTSTPVDTSGLDEKSLEMLKKRAQLQGDVAESTRMAYEEEKRRLEVLIEQNVEESKKAKALEDLNVFYDQIKSKQGRQDAASTKFNIPAIDEVLAKTIKMAETQELINKAKKEGNGEVKQMASSLGKMVGIDAKFSDSKIGKLTDTFALMSGTTEEARGNALLFGQELASTFSMQNIGLNIFNKVFSESMDVLNAFDESLASLSGKTGTVGKFNDVLYDTQRAGNLLGVTMDGAANAIVALNAGTSQFAKLSKKTQTDLAISTSQMEALGVSASDTADFMENAFKIMNMSAAEAIDTQTELAMSGVALGMTADKMIKDFNAASKTLAVYGKGSVKVFKGLAAQAKAAGVEVSTLLGIVEKFDTFSGAAEGAAQFNALLGTQLSTTQMLMMTEDERMKTLVESVQAQGIAFGDMDKFTQKSIAAAAGITDMNEANRIFSMSLGDYEANRREMENNAAAQQKFDDAVQATVPTMLKFQNLATEMIVMVQPALEKLGEVADYLTDFMQGLSKETKETAGTIALFVGGLMAIMPIIAVGGGFMAGLAAIGPAIAAMGTGIATGLGAVTAVVAGSAGVAGGVMLAFLAGGAVIGATMAAMAESDAKIAESNAKMVGQGSDTIKAMADIGSADFSGIATKFKGVMQELSTMGSDVKVTSTLQNLALMNTGTAFSLTGAKIAASTTNVTANVSNIFDGMKLTLDAGGESFEAYIRNVAATTAVT